jgi:hypothetical protein
MPSLVLQQLSKALHVRTLKETLSGARSLGWQFALALITTDSIH